MEYRYHWKHRNCKRPTYYTMILYSTKIENTAIKITKSLTLFHSLHSKLLYWSARRSLPVLFQEVLTGMRYFQLIGNLELILNLDKILVHVMRYCIIKSVYTGTANWHWNWFFFLIFFQMWKHLFLQAKQGTNKTSGPEHCPFKKINSSF